MGITDNLFWDGEVVLLTDPRPIGGRPLRAMASGAEHVVTLLEHKAAGNECYKVKDYAGAIKAYGEAAKLLPRFPDDDDSDDEGGPSAAEIVSKMDPELLKQGAVRLKRFSFPVAPAHEAQNSLTCPSFSLSNGRLCCATARHPTWR